MGKDNKIINSITWGVLLVIIIVITKQYWIFPAIIGLIILCNICVGIFYFCSWLYGVIRKYLKNYPMETDISKYIENGEYSRAISKINDVLYFGNKNTDLYYQLAELYLKINKGNSGLVCLNRLKKILTADNKAEELITCEQYIEDYTNRVQEQTAKNEAEKIKAEREDFYNQRCFKGKNIIEAIPELNLALTRDYKNELPYYEIYFCEIVMDSTNNVKDILWSWQFNIESTLSIPENQTLKINLDDLSQDKETFCKEIKDLCEKNQFKEAETKIIKTAELILNTANNGKSNYKISIYELNNLLKKIEKNINTQHAEEIYEDVVSELNKPNPDYDSLLEELNTANTLKSCKKHWDLKKEITKKRDIALAEKSYNQAKVYFDKNKYDKAQASINKALKLVPNNSAYIELKQLIENEYTKYKSEHEAPKQYQQGLEHINNGNFSEAIKCLEAACKLKPDNEDYKNALITAKTGKIDIVNCTQNALISLDFLDYEKVEQIIKAREEGNMWYDYRDFCEYFKLNEPHQLMGSEEKIIFPLKQGNKYGRRLDV